MAVPNDAPGARLMPEALLSWRSGSPAGVVLQPVAVAPRTSRLMLLLTVQIVAIVFGLWTCACRPRLASTLGYNFLFIPPLYTFTVADPENVVTLLFFAVTALITSCLTSLVRSQALIARSARVSGGRRRNCVRRLLTPVSHDLRTPLASILGSATTLKGYRASLDEDAQRQLIDTIAGRSRTAATASSPIFST